MTREAWLQFLADPSTGPRLQAMVDDNARVDREIAEAERRQRAAQNDETVTRGIRGWFRQTEPRA